MLHVFNICVRHTKMCLRYFPFTDINTQISSNIIYHVNFSHLTNPQTSKRWCFPLLSGSAFVVFVPACHLYIIKSSPTTFSINAWYLLLLLRLIGKWPCSGWCELLEWHTIFGNKWNKVAQISVTNMHIVTVFLLWISCSPNLWHSLWKSLP